MSVVLGKRGQVSSGMRQRAGDAARGRLALLGLCAPRGCARAVVETCLVLMLDLGCWIWGRASKLLPPAGGRASRVML